MTSPPLPGPKPYPEGDRQPWENLFENAPVGLWEVGATGIVVAINQTLLKRLACTRADVVDRQNIEALVSPESSVSVQGLIECCRQDGHADGVVLMWRGDDECRYWPGEVVATAVYDAQGQFAGWRGSVRVTPAATSQTDRLLQERTLEAIERLASGVAHKFNNLLQVIQGYAELGLITLESSHPVHGNLGRIKEAAQRAAAIVQGLVMFSRRQTVRRRPLDLSVFVAKLEGQLRRVVPAGIELRVAPVTRPVQLFADASSLEQVVIHVVINACEAMPSGGTVTLDTHLVRYETADMPANLPTGTYACLDVSDTGAGIDPALVGQIFEPFFTTKDTATGLGLAVVWGLVKQHEGRVEVINQPGRGTTFRIYLPASEAKTPEPVVTEAS
jgi:two-component system, cell cycle sensor histidine kinase and response regulator CckA